MTLYVPAAAGVLLLTLAVGALVLVALGAVVEMVGATVTVGAVVGGTLVAVGAVGAVAVADSGGGVGGGCVGGAVGGTGVASLWPQAASVAASAVDAAAIRNCRRVRDGGCCIVSGISHIPFSASRAAIRAR